MKTQQTPQLTPLQQHAASRKLLEAEVLSHAWTDEAFRDKLKSDPASALSEIGCPPPRGKTIRILAEDANTLTLVIPQRPASSDEVNDAELESVAGGGLISDGKCSLYDAVADDVKKGDLVNAAAGWIRSTYHLFTAQSWGWG